MATYAKAIDWLNENYPFFTTLVVNLGSPVEGARGGTAEIRPTEDGDDWEFAINSDFFEPLTDAEMGSVMGHEALHVALNHLSEALSGEFERHDILTIAHEVIVNDRLANEGFVLPGNPYYGPEHVGCDTAGMTTEQVYELLLKEQEQEQEQDTEENDGDSENQEKPSGGDGSGANSNDGDGVDSASPSCSGVQGEMTQELVDKIQGAVRDAIEGASKEQVESLSSSLRDELDTPFNDLDSKGDFSGMGCGRETAEESALRNGTTLEWVKILAAVNPDILKKKGRMPSRTRPSWHSPRRTLAHMYPQVMVPNRIERGEAQKKGSLGNSKPLIVVALDQSSSIPTHIAETMRAMAQSAPSDLFEIECCTFSTFFEPFDVNAARNKIARGGTDFSAVEDFVRQVANKRRLDYPKAVVCITDGEARFNSKRPTPEQLAENWTWVGIDNFTLKRLRRWVSSSIESKRVLNLKDFAKRP